MNLNAMQFYNPVTRSINTSVYYNLDTVHHKNTHFGLTYNGGIFVATYGSYYDPDTYPYPQGIQVLYLPPKS